MKTPVSCGNCTLGKNAPGSNAQSISVMDIGENMRKCNELSIELEGVKLDAVITESRLSNNIYQNSKVIEQIHSQMINMQNIQNITDERSTITNREQSNTHTISKQNEISENPCNKSVVLQDEQFCLSHGHQSDKLQIKVSNNSNSVRDYQCENSKSNCNTVEGTPQGQPIRRCKTKAVLHMCLGNLPLIELPSSNMQKNKQSKLPNKKKVYSKRYRHGYYAKRQINTQSQRGITKITDRIPLDAVSEITKHQGNHQTSQQHENYFRKGFRVRPPPPRTSPAAEPAKRAEPVPRLHRQLPRHQYPLVSILHATQGVGLDQISRDCTPNHYYAMNSQLSIVSNITTNNNLFQTISQSINQSRGVYGQHNHLILLEIT
jgi:hypothetical protein